MNLSPNNRQPGFWAVLLLLPCVALTGCSSSRVPVEGAFSLDNKPVTEGTITFAPDQGAEGAASLLMVRTEIKDGKYAFNRSNGPLPGKYRVYASVKQKTGRQIKTDEPPGTKDEEVELMGFFNAEKHTVEVKDSGDNKFDFTAKAGGANDTTTKPRKGD